MRLQTAIDRVDLEEAARLIEAVRPSADIVEVGTSLIKDFGLTASVAALKQQFPQVELLADIKTIDEGAYEFRKAYEAGAGIATVMGGASLATIQACADVAREFKRAYLIDLLEVEEEKISRLTCFEDAIFCLHLPADKAGQGLEEMVHQQRGALQGARHIAVAGGVTLQTLPVLAKAGVEIVVVGGAITKAENPAKAAQAFKQAMHAL